MRPQFANLDANESAFFARELEHIKAKTYDVDFEANRIREFVPVVHDAGPGAQSITWYAFTRVGIAKLVADYAKDLPRVDVYGTKNTTPVETIADSYGYNVIEIAAAAMAKRPLSAMKATAAREAFEDRVDAIGRNGDTPTGLGGFLNNANVPITTVPNGAASTKPWNTKTAAEILLDVQSAYAATDVATKGRETFDTMLLPPTPYGYISTTLIATNSSVTILKFLLENMPELKAIHNWSKLTNAGAGGAIDRGVLYRKDPNKLTLEIPQEFLQLAAQAQGLEYVVPCYGRIGGVIVYKPLSIRYLDNI
jgi:hypothetical protein